MYSAHRAAVQALASAELGVPSDSGVPASAPSVRMRFICSRRWSAKVSSNLRRQF